MDSGKAKNDDLALVILDAQRRSITFLYNFPWWLLVLFVLGVLVFTLIFSQSICPLLTKPDFNAEVCGKEDCEAAFVPVCDTTYARIFDYLRDGILMTITVSGVSYLCAVFFGLLIGMVRAYPPKPAKGGFNVLISGVRLLLYNLATLYINVLRGIPILVVLLVVAFVLLPPFRPFVEGIGSGVVNLLRGIGFEVGNFTFRPSNSPISAIVALSMTYSAFLSETFRAGIQSIERGQTEAAQSLGMNSGQTMFFIILPQAIRRVLPPLGNDLISMIKDSSLVAILGIEDITQKAKLWSSTTFRFTDTYFVAATIYLTMVVIVTLLVRVVERRLTIADRR
jgi:polar amino acid transport system permease protein